MQFSSSWLAILQFWRFLNCGNARLARCRHERWARWRFWFELNGVNNLEDPATILTRALACRSSSDRKLLIPFWLNIMTELRVMCIVGRGPPAHNVHKLCELEHDFDQQECNFEGPALCFREQFDNTFYNQITQTRFLVLFTDDDDSLSIVSAAPMIPRHLTSSQSLTCVHFTLATLSHSP